MATREYYPWENMPTNGPTSVPVYSSAPATSPPSFTYTFSSDCIDPGEAYRKTFAPLPKPIQSRSERRKRAAMLRKSLSRKGSK